MASTMIRSTEEWSAALDALADRLGVGGPGGRSAVVDLAVAELAGRYGIPMPERLRPNKWQPNRSGRRVAAGAGE